MESKFNTHRRLTLTDEPQEICYVNALPGAGKTHTFVNHVALPHIVNGANSVLVYAAPTDCLIDQTEKNLIEVLKKRGIDHRNRIIRISSTTARANGSRVAQDFLTALTGAAATEERAAYPAVADGSIILCTHECIARLPRALMMRRALDRVVLVYDEARACLQDNYSLKLPEALYAHLTEPKVHTTKDGKRYRCALITSTAASSETSRAALGLWQWTHKGVAVPTVDDLRELMPRVKNDRITRAYAFLQNVADSALDVYVSIKQQKKTNEYIAYNVFSPANMFEGFNRVLILSAFFESSQMYHFLNESSPTREVTFSMRDVTDEYIDADRMRELIRRLHNVYLVPLLDDQKKSLSKTTLNESIAVAGKLTDDQLSLLNTKWCKVHGKRVRNYHVAYREWLALGDERAGTVHDAAQEAAHGILRKLDKARPIQGTLIQSMVKRALRVQRAFFREHGIEAEPLLLGVNANYANYTQSEDATRRTEPVWQRESLDQFGERIQQLPIVAHGLNSYIDSHSCAFLASMKYNAQQTELLRAVVGGYDPDRDRTLDYALQLLWRCNVRHVDGHEPEPVVLMLTDNVIAQQLHDRFNELARHYLGAKCKTVLPIRSAHSFLLKKYGELMVVQYASNDRERVKKMNSRAKETNRGKINLAVRSLYRKSAPGARHNSLTAMISKCQKTDPERAEELRAERAKLMTESQWKKTPEGKAAIEAAVLNLTADADTKATKETKMIDAAIDSTFERVYAMT
ncbi:hypothetical protein [Burkholderia cenocepacia]|uniref:hypothetical protein n=1 Tax=Burkholderia cenocepacia TaxID=95486 RepID=UPI0028596B2F|nr:hypothetical protein [Burkholderia cenocepacia]MDR8054232.1 hypothetical protein [Burkholderia cenocepacia]MDR8064675.1 hypothetical protein [Burkholderia cenocepacia]